MIKPMTGLGITWRRLVENQIARVVYEAMRQESMFLNQGKVILPNWDHAPLQQRTEMKTNAEWFMDNPNGGAAEAHEAWVQRMTGAGWTIGRDYDEAKKVHPSLKPFEHLASDEQLLDLMARAITIAIIQNWWETKKLIENEMEAADRSG